MYLPGGKRSLAQRQNSCDVLNWEKVVSLNCLLYSRYCRLLCNNELELQHLYKQMQLQLYIWQKLASCLQQVESGLTHRDVRFGTRMCCPPKLSCSLKYLSRTSGKHQTLLIFPEHAPLLDKSLLYNAKFIVIKYSS